MSARPFICHTDISVYGLTCLLVLLVSYVTLFCGIEENAADRSNQRVDSESNYRKEKVRKSARGVSLGLKAGVVDDNAAYPSKEEEQQKSDYVIVIHF